MSSNSNYCLEPLNPNIVDNSTLIKSTFHKDHNVYTHLGCVLLRCIIGLTLILHISPDISSDIKRMLMLFCIIIIIIFSYKFIHNANNNIVVWKTYLRTVIAYSASLALIYKNKYDIAGTIIIIDALMGLQSRHMAFISSYINEKKEINEASSLVAKYPSNI